MGDSSDEEFASEWIPYSKRPEWRDVTPLEQDDGDNPVVVIAYSERCKSRFFVEFFHNSSLFNWIISLVSQGRLQSFSCDFIEWWKISEGITPDWWRIEIECFQLHSLAIPVISQQIFVDSNVSIQNQIERKVGNLN